MCFENINGDDILIYFGVVVIFCVDGVFVFIDICELKIDIEGVWFYEMEGVLNDVEVVGYMWVKINKDGLFDWCFKENY